MDPNQHPEEGDEEGVVSTPEGVTLGGEAVVVTSTNPEEPKNEYTSAADPMLSQGIPNPKEFRSKENELPGEKLAAQQQQFMVAATPIAGLNVSATGPVQNGEVANAVPEGGYEPPVAPIHEKETDDDEPTATTNEDVLALLEKLETATSSDSLPPQPSSGVPTTPNEFTSAGNPEALAKRIVSVKSNFKKCAKTSVAPRKVTVEKTIEKGQLLFRGQVSAKSNGGKLAFAVVASTQERLLSVDFEVFGKVYGVQFRKHTKNAAQSYDLVGWCLKNTSNGTIEGHLQGSPENIAKMKTWLQNVGSPNSRIDRAVFENEKEIDKLDYVSFELEL